MEFINSDSERYNILDPLASRLKYTRPKGETFREMQHHAGESKLYGEGDMKLVWVNEGDLIEFGEEWDLPEKCPTCGRTES